MERIGFIGLGRMGKPMAINLKRKTNAEMTVYDIADAPMSELEAIGARRAGGVAEVARNADVVITMLPSGKEVEEVVTGADGVVANGRGGMLVLDMSTVDPSSTDRLAAATQAGGLAMVDAPVGRLASHADRGESLFMVGANQADFERVKPMLQAMGNSIHHCGPVGAGIRTKLVNNYLAISSCQMNAEALALAAKFGLSLEKTLEVLFGTTAFNGQLKINWTDKTLKGDIEPGFTIDLAHKDLSLVVNAANDAKVAMPLAAAARECFSLARSTRYHAKDFSGMLDHWCERSGIEKPQLP